MKLFQIEELDITSDMVRNAANGWASHLFGVPGVKCPHCDDAWGSCDELPFTCPDRIKEEVESVYKKNPCRPLNEWKFYVERWTAHFPADYQTKRIYPGTSFQPLQWNMKRVPQADFFWPLLNVVVSSEVQRLLTENAISGISFHPVGFKKKNHGSYYNTFFELDPREQFWEKESELKESCAECGYRYYEMTEEQEKRYEALREAGLFPAQYIPDYDVFKSHIYGGFIVTRKVYDLISHLDFRNCEVQELTVGDL